MCCLTTRCCRSWLCGLGLVLWALGAASTRGAAPVASADGKSERGVGPGLSIRVDPRVELVCVVFRLAGHAEYGQCRIPAYLKAVDDHFHEFRNHAVVEHARRLRGTRGVGYDACMSIAVHLADPPVVVPPVAFDPMPEGLDPRWTSAEAAAFVEELRAFVAESRFPEFYESQATLYREAEARMRDLLEEKAHLEWFPAFFGDRPGSRFEVILGLLNGPNNYGAHSRSANAEETLYAVIGAWFTDAEGLPRYDTAVVETLVHEFAHSYANPIVDRHREAFRAAGMTLYEPVAQAMERQAYGNWETMIRETLVRAFTIRYLRTHVGPLAAMKRTLDDQSRSFRWSGELATFLSSYEDQRERFHTLEDFTPELVRFFEERALRVKAETGGR